jgi:hypothetical protein
MKTPTIKPLDIHNRPGEYTLAVATVGYEERARFAAETLGISAKEKLAIGFVAQKELSYERNSSWYERAGYHVVHVDDEEYGRLISEKITSAIGSCKDEGSISIDISSMTRLRLAVVLSYLARLPLAVPLRVDFLYTLAKFSAPSQIVQANSHVGPVLPEFAGWWTEPEKPPIAILGLGYEENKALGAVEHIQASQRWTFTPVSPEADYTPVLEQANRTLLLDVAPERQLSYWVDRPFDLFVRLESLVYGLQQLGNPVILPFGPKIFALTAMLVKLLHSRVAVWRVSAQGAEPAINRKSSGNVYGLTALFFPPAASDKL